MKHLLTFLVLCCCFVAMAQNNPPSNGNSPKKFAGPHDLGPVPDFPPIANTNDTAEVSHAKHVEAQKQQKAFRDALTASADLAVVTQDKGKQLETVGIVDSILQLLGRSSHLKEDQKQAILQSGVERVQTATGAKDKAAIAKLFEVKKAGDLWASPKP